MAIQANKVIQRSSDMAVTGSVIRSMRLELIAYRRRRQLSRRLFLPHRPPAPEANTKKNHKIEFSNQEVLFDLIYDLISFFSSINGEFCFFALIALLSVHLALFADPPQISPSPTPKLAADSTLTISPLKPTTSLAPAPTNEPHGSISSSPSLPPSDVAPTSSPSTSPSPPSQSLC
ncbi:hypothetical protein CRG98_045875 [Punica granatum]|uniref:Uncharacterized protein n=1 Tax=Punica granatum TaxID=22663 RepID=A0A2I0HPS9_PUNGR|nr:hypothetical protein CRG98_045875 [Punica granatum]